VYTETYDFSPLSVLVTTTLDAVGQTTAFVQRLGYSSRQERDEDFAGVAESAAEIHSMLERYVATQTSQPPSPT
jgi:hypothetical protein